MASCETSDEYVRILCIVNEGSKVRFRKIRRGGKRRKKSKNITLYYVNINGLKSKLPSLLGLIDKHKYDVIFLSETKVY